jgi:hypothetical protein
VSAILDLLENTWTNPFCGDRMGLLSISTGLAAKDLLKAREKEVAHAERLVKLDKGFVIRSRS